MKNLNIVKWLLISLTNQQEFIHHACVGGLVEKTHSVRGVLTIKNVCEWLKLGYIFGASLDLCPFLTCDMAGKAL